MMNPLALLLGLLVLLAGPTSPSAAPGTTRPSRVVSLVPSLTETAFALGAGAQLAGRSRYCVQPAAARRLPEVGGYLDPSWELLATLKPDLVLLTPQSAATAARLRDWQVPVASIAQDRLPQILDGMESLAVALGRPGRGRRLADSLARELDALRPARPAAHPPRVLLVAGRSTEAGPPRDIWAIGRGSWLSDLLELLGAVNVVGDLRPGLPALSREGVAALRPDWIVELWPSSGLPRSPEALEADWRAWPELEAVQRGRVRVVADERLLVPGPRLVEGARLLRNALRER
jgi:iron complex transport system substrate-binding protein